MATSYTGLEVSGFKVGPLLGVGGMGEVYQATNLENNKSVAIKFLRKEYTSDPAVQARFIREIRIMESLTHENIVPIYRYGMMNDVLYYAMRLIQGMTLSTMFKRQRFTPTSYWQVLKPVASALEFGHSQGVVHRDIKPDNVFIENRDGKIHVYMGDFGLGKRKDIDVTLTEADAIIGTPHYMSPEGIMGERHDKRSDIYSLSVLSYEALLGIVPFNEEHAHKTAIAHVTQIVPRPTSLNPEFPPSIEAVLLKGLEKSPDKRQQSVQQFADEYYLALTQLSEEARRKQY